MHIHCDTMLSTHSHYPLWCHNGCSYQCHFPLLCYNGAKQCHDPLWCHNESWNIKVVQVVSTGVISTGDQGYRDHMKTSQRIKQVCNLVLWGNHLTRGHYLWKLKNCNLFISSLLIVSILIIQGSYWPGKSGKTWKNKSGQGKSWNFFVSLKSQGKSGNLT